MDANQTWTPNSRDLQAELPALMARLRQHGFAMSRVMYNFADWDDAPRRVMVGGKLVKLGGFNTMQRGSIIAVDGTGTERVEVHDTRGQV